MLEDPIQMSKTVTCEPFQIYFYENLFFPTKTVKLKATSNAIEILLNELFTLDRERNEQLTTDTLDKNKLT